MRMQNTIFSDQDEKVTVSQRDKNAKPSQNEYREGIKQAYREGIKDARAQQTTTRSTLPIKEELAQKREGKEAAVQSEAKEKEEVRQRFKTITQRHDITLLTAKTVFPFALFPDTITIDTTKVTISQKKFFATEFVSTVPLKDLADVTMQTLWFLGSLDIRYMPQSNSPGMNNPVDIRIANLRREDAIKAKNFLKGALVAKAEEIDIAKLTPEEVTNVLDKFGKTQGLI